VINPVPRVVVVTRETEYQLLIAQHATHGQAAFFLRERGQAIEELIERHRRFEDALQQILSALPHDWRRNRVQRSELDRFLFEPDDLVVTVGQDGLIANLAKYLSGQSVIGVNPDADQFDGVLARFSATEAVQILDAAMASEAPIQSRTMVRATLDDGQRMLALNELFIGHRSHQSARYTIGTTTCGERQSSSGIIVTTGTGATGWARSIQRSRYDSPALPEPEDRQVVFYVREAFPSRSTGTDITAGVINHGETLQIRSEMNREGVIFGDGIETDHLDFDWGRQVVVDIAGQRLALVTPD